MGTGICKPGEKPTTEIAVGNRVIINCRVITVQLSCVLAKNTQFIRLGAPAQAVKFVIKGQFGFGVNITAQVSPAGIFELSPTSWPPTKANQTIESRIRALKDGEATIQFQANGQDVGNKIKLTTKINSAKDVFDYASCKRIIDELTYVKPFADANSPAHYGGNYCMQAAERGLSELLNNSKDFYSVEHGTHKAKNAIGFRNLGAQDRARVFNSKGFVQSNLSFNSYKVNESARKEMNDSIDVTAATNVYRTKQQEFVQLSDAKKKEIYQHILKNLNNKIGFHVYYVSITGGFHTLLLIIDYRFPCEATYAFWDQHGRTSSYGNLQDIGEGFRKQTSWTLANSSLNRYITDINTHGGAINRRKHFDSMESKIWKIKRK